IMHKGDSYFAMAQSWFALFASPEDLPEAHDLFLFLGLYLAHVTIGELFFRKSLGKAMTGLEILMVDGKPHGAGPVLIRNLVRIPEGVVGLVIIYMLMSDRHQRLGDLLARTIVVAQQTPDSPEGGEKNQEKADEKKEISSR